MAPRVREAQSCGSPAGGGSSLEEQNILQGAAGRRQAGVGETLQEAWRG